MVSAGIRPDRYAETDTFPTTSLADRGQTARVAQAGALTVPW